MNLEEEVRNGYTISAKMKRLWEMELDMVKSFVSVCEKYHLQYWIMGGTLLGAVRHKGFIPWDNDIDLAMPRKDFNILLEIGPTEFSEPLFFQSPVTEHSKFFCTFIKIRNKNGTAASRYDFDKGLNCGVFIDIFCLDEIPNSHIIRKLYFRGLSEIAKMSRFATGEVLKRGLINRIKQFIQRMVYIVIFNRPDSKRLFAVYHKAAGYYQGRNCRCLAHHAFGFHSNFIWEKEDWDNTVYLSFEDISLCAPKGYDAILRRQYGDYMIIPDDKSTHDYFDFDPDTPYLLYFK